jgi:hypothetical protein
MEVRQRKELPTFAHETMYHVVDRAPPPRSALSPRTTRGFLTLSLALVFGLAVLTLGRAMFVPGASQRVVPHALTARHAAARTALAACGGHVHGYGAQEDTGTLIA